MLNHGFNLHETQRMKILLTNDDGIFAPGLAALYKELIKIGEVIVVAPSDSRSGASHSITFLEPLVCNKVEINGLFTGYSVQGSPADCVKLAVMQLHKDPIDLLVAGINNGANAGICQQLPLGAHSFGDVIYHADCPHVIAVFILH